MKLFSRSSSPLSLDRSLSSTTSKSKLSKSTKTSFPSRSDSTVTRSRSATPPRRPRLRHGPPPFFEGWASLRVDKSRGSELRFCTLAGPRFSWSASPRQSILAGSIVIFGTVITAEEFPTLRITIKHSDDQKLIIFPENKREHSTLYEELQRAATRSLTNVYAFQRDLRASAFGRTSEAVDVYDDNLALVKVVPKADLSNYHIRMARREACTLCSIPQHPNCVSIIDVYESVRTVYLVTDHVPAKSLDQVVNERGTLCEADVALIVKDCLRAVQHLHKHGIVHRLVHPENVLVIPDVDLVDAYEWKGVFIGSAKLCNFELATSDAYLDDTLPMLDSFSENGPLFLRHATYLAPEVVMGQLGDSKQDTWSLGILMYFLLVGCTPFDNGLSTLSELTNVIGTIKGMPTFSGPLWSGVSSGAKDLCAHLLHADPAARLSTMEALNHPWLDH